MRTQNLLQTINLSLLNVDDCCVSNWNFRKISSPFTRMYYIKGGEGHIIHNLKRYKLLPGKLYLIPSFTLSNYSSPSYLEHYYIHFIPWITGDTNLFDIIDINYEVSAIDEDIRLMKKILELNPGRKLINPDPCKYSKSNLLPKLETLNTSRQVANFLETQGMLLQLFSRFIKTDNDIEELHRFNPNQKISHAIDYINQNLAKAIQISELADFCHLSDDYFSRLFLKVTGRRPIDYINQKKIESSQLQLITTNDSIEKIALDNGVDNFSYFNRMFKKYSCTTPGDYRRLHRFV